MTKVFETADAEAIVVEEPTGDVASKAVLMTSARSRLQQWEKKANVRRG